MNEAEQSLGRGIVPAGIDGGYERVPTRSHLALQPYGIQTSCTWAAADTEEKQLIDAMRCEYLWRVSVSGENLLLRLVYGTQAAISINLLRLPFEALIPGQVGLIASKLDPAAPATARVTLTVATGGVPAVRSLIAAPQALPSNARNYTALVASTLTVAGIPGVAVAVGATLPLVAPSVVTVGAGIVELTL